MSSLSFLLFTTNPLESSEGAEEEYPFECKLSTIIGRGGCYENQRTHDLLVEHSTTTQQHSMVRYVPRFSRTVHTTDETYDEWCLIPVEALVYSKSLRHFSCPICLREERVVIPVVLGCGHCLCVGCYNQLVCHNGTIHVPCPICRAINVNPVNGSLHSDV